MTALTWLAARPRLVWAVVLLVTLVGAVAWRTMPRQEDPSFVPRFANLVVPFPGADALSVERLVVRPLEDELTFGHEQQGGIVVGRLLQRALEDRLGLPVLLLGDRLLPLLH